MNLSKILRIGQAIIGTVLVVTEVVDLFSDEPEVAHD